MKNIAIDLTWIRPGKNGGTESYIRNLLDGFTIVVPNTIKFTLLVSLDNAYSFEKYKDVKSFEIITCTVHSSSQKERILWQNFKLKKILKSLNIKYCFEPVYSIPFIPAKEIKFISVIHDLQAIHFPQYFSKTRVWWMKKSWKNSIRNSSVVITISNYVREDISNRYPRYKDKIKVIYNPIKEEEYNFDKENEVLSKYNLNPKKYFYTVSSLLPHKNLKTIIYAIAALKDKQSENLLPLVISGVGGKSRSELDKIINDCSIDNYIIFTPYIENYERDILYKNSHLFLFPSIFEGFGMPPIESMVKGIPVLTTKKTSIYEVTEGACDYVENPLDISEWVDKIDNNMYHYPTEEDIVHYKEKYNISNIAWQYIKLFEKEFKD